MLYATEYEILREVKASGRVKIPLAREPQRVATIINEQAFLVDGAMDHNRTVFLEDRMHDWDWRNGFLTYYTRVAEVADIVIAYDVRKS
jgi:hypothetical protein